MEEVIRFALLGLGLGALYSLAAQGLVLIYRGSGVLNFAHGAIGMVAAFISWDIWVEQGLPWALGLVVGVAVSAGIGALTHLFVMRPLRRASSLARIVATLGVLILLQGLVVLRYGPDIITISSALPTDLIRLGGDITITADRVILVTVAGALTAALWWVYKYTSFGLGTAAVAENQRVAASLGWSPDRIATINWALGSGLAGLAAILIAPIVQLQAATMTNLVIAALAAALVASFRSFPIVFVAAIVIGIAQTEVTRYVATPGIGQSVPFAVIVAVMVLRGKALPTRDFFLQRLPGVGTGRIRPGLVVAGVAAAAALIAVVPPTWQESFAITFGMALVLLSIVVLTGYAGQISLAQYAVAGLGVWIVARLDATQDVPFVLACLIGLALAFPIGMLLALPAVRARGLNLAVATLGLGAAIELIVFNNGTLSGGLLGTDVHEPKILGFSIEPIMHPTRYALFCLALFTVAALAVANVRRGRSGRRMLAVRTNERAAAALGISVSETKTFAFGFSAAVATLGGIAIAYRSDVVIFSEFTNFTSINAVAWTVIGGIGYVFGPIIGATLAPSALGTQIGNSLFGNVTEYIIPIGGLILILLLMQNEDGAAKQNILQFRAIAKKLRRKAEKPAAATALDKPTRIEKVASKTLTVEGVTVRFGGVVALSDLSLTVPPGKIVGLIGPNGAGKTTAIDAITGFVEPATGHLDLDGVDITGLHAAQRARVGVSRSFQSLELFEDMTVLDNLRTASDPRDRLSYVRDMVYPLTPPLPAAVVTAVHEFQLEGDLDRLVSDLPYGRRRLVAIARAVATQPSVLLLDEPAAGLGERESRELARLVRRLADEWGIGVLLVEHDMNFVMAVCDEIVVLDFGRTIAQGTPEVVRADPATIKAYLGSDEVIESEPTRVKETL
ncbi:ATP-binding cassette domain-containing protein [Solirubrobacter sp. CPCC 204708]|uniref:Branched-chain amino acid ABC transporter permease/ATP-binding protein n=1 Tax=Solirubrobacter deserti TaxID=2282478 RepID=A0ABT4RFY9_9ACTN|nr:branched-chain amino acid ABC transporter permease/ATP-binding protein [Solirubrobacter deserti]MBE2318187.1 ATP-binding cassette domain-containing protein [Solirubrobacter deserti]MDA0137468.1 branched-chain amino acid ABC transporter permease/ATP-binding protein [Solirubrobacter deserti]